MLLPGAFFTRQENTPMPSHHWEYMPTGLTHHNWEYFFDILFQRFVLSLPPQPKQFARLTFAESLLTSDKMIEVTPSRSMSLLTLQVGQDTSLAIVVMASVIIGSEGLDLLLSSVPWTVYGVCLGAKRYWACAMKELPVILRMFPPGALIAIVDAYDVMLLPCGRSIVDEYRAYDADIVWGADSTCFPNAKACKACHLRYSPGSPGLEACQTSGFPHLNGGVYMGKPHALADVLEWMREQGAAIGTDDQENKWHAYNHFPDRIVLDHRQRIFTCLFGGFREQFHVENCTVVSNHTGEPACMVHANGGTKWEILMPLVQELEAQGCRQKPKRERQSSWHYSGLRTPKMIWW